MRRSTMCDGRLAPPGPKLLPQAAEERSAAARGLLQGHGKYPRLGHGVALDLTTRLGVVSSCENKEHGKILPSHLPGAAPVDVTMQALCQLDDPQHTCAREILPSGFKLPFGEIKIKKTPSDRICYIELNQYYAAGVAQSNLGAISRAGPATMDVSTPNSTFQSRYSLGKMEGGKMLASVELSPWQITS